MSLKKHVLVLRLSPAQNRTVERLTQKLQINKTSVIRLAITRLAEAEGLMPPLKC